MIQIQSVYDAIKNHRHVAVKQAKHGRIQSSIADSTTPEEAASLYLTRCTGLLGSSAKVQKGEKYEYKTKVMYLAPHKLSGLQVCPDATPSCRRACLGHSSGNLRFHVQSEILKTWALHYHPELFMMKLQGELWAHSVKSKCEGYQPVARLNGSSDLVWDVDGKGAILYDYTKSIERAYASIGSDYHLTYSISETEQSLNEGIDLVRRGGTAAIVTHRSKTKAAKFANMMQETYNVPVVDGDRHDLRFLDTGALVTLTAKGQKLKGSDPFVWTEQRIAG